MFDNIIDKNEWEYDFVGWLIYIFTAVFNISFFKV